MPTPTGKILSVDEEAQLLQPIDDYIGKIQQKVDALRADGTTRIVSLQTLIDNTKNDRVLTKAERDEEIAAPSREEDAESTAEHGKNKALEQKLPDDLPARRANRSADRKLTRARGAAGGEHRSVMSSGGAATPVAGC